MGPMEAAAAGMESAAKNYLGDLEAMSEAQILESAGGTARSAVDFTFETAIINKRIAARLNGVEPPAMPEGEGWTVAPEELRSKSAIAEYMKSACDELIAVAKTKSEEDGAQLMPLFGGEKPTFYAVNFAAMHTMYHCAQLNFIQSLAGDMEVHWG